jgi:hypothetical protein
LREVAGPAKLGTELDFKRPEILTSEGAKCRQHILPYGFHQDCAFLMFRHFNMQ